MEGTVVILWPDIVTAIAAVLTIGVLLAAAVCAWLELHHIERAREAHILADLSRRWDEELLREPRQAVEKYKDGTKLEQAVKEFKENNDEQFYMLLRLPDFFEELGLLVEYDCLNLQLAKDMFGTAIKYHYTGYKPTIEFLRSEYKDKTIYKFFEDLAKKC